MALHGTRPSAIHNDDLPGRANATTDTKPSVKKEEAHEGDADVKKEEADVDLVLKLVAVSSEMENFALMNKMQEELKMVP